MSKTAAQEARIILPEDMPEIRQIDSIEGKGLEPSDIRKVTPEVFFVSGAKIRSAILAQGGVVYFGNDDGKVFAVDASSKQARWIYDAGLPVQTRPILAAGRLLFLAGNSVYVVDAASGRKARTIAYPAASAPRISQIPFAFNDSYAAVSGGAAYFATLDGTIVAADIGTGEIIWVYEKDAGGAVTSGIDYSNGKLYFANSGGSLCCLDAATGRLVFRSHINAIAYAPMLIAESRVYIAGRSCILYCVDAETGECLWSSYSHDKTTWFSGGCVIGGERLFACVSDEHTVAVYNKGTGEFLRIYPTETNAYTAPALDGETLVVAATDVYSLKKAYIMGFDIANNTKLWQAELDDAVLSSPAVCGGAVYLGSDSGNLYSIGIQGQ